MLDVKRVSGPYCYSSATLCGTRRLGTLLGEAAALALGMPTVLSMLPRAAAIARRGLALLAAYAAFVLVTVAILK